MNETVADMIFSETAISLEMLYCTETRNNPHLMPNIQLQSLSQMYV